MSPSLVRVVVVDADPRARARLVSRLEAPGVRVVARSSPEDALEFVARARPELVLLGAEAWSLGWSPRFTGVSPDTIVFPAAAPPSLGAA